MPRLARPAGLSIAAALLVLLLAACGARAPVSLLPAGPIALAVVTWNMDAGRGDLPRLLDDLASGRLTGAAVPDYVILLQEAIVGGTSDVMALASVRRLSTFFVPVRANQEGASGNAILSTRQLVDARAIDLPRERQHRAAATATLDVAGERLFVVSVHLENRTGVLRGLFSDVARGRQAEALLRSLPAEGHGIAGGDLNTWLGPGERTWRAFAERFPDTPTDPPQPTFRERLVLDHLFFDLPDGWKAHRRVTADAYGSDHHPVLGVIVTS